MCICSLQTAPPKTQLMCLLLSLLPQPPTVACKMEAQSEYVHIAYTLCARMAPICMLRRCLSTKFLHRSSVGTLLRVLVGWVCTYAMIKEGERERGENARVKHVKYMREREEEGDTFTVINQSQPFSSFAADTATFFLGGTTGRLKKTIA